MLILNKPTLINATSKPNGGYQNLDRKFSLSSNFPIQSKANLLDEKWVKLPLHPNDRDGEQLTQSSTENLDAGDTGGGGDEQTRLDQLSETVTNFPTVKVETDIAAAAAEANEAISKAILRAIPLGMAKMLCN